MEDARYLKRKVKAGRIDVHPSECAIVVYYEVEAYILGDAGETMHGERKQCQKVIHLGKAMSKSTNIPQLSQTIIEKCKLIHPSKLPELEQLLSFLQKRKKEQGSALEEASNKRLLAQPSAQPAQMGDIETYVDMLYEEMDDKIKATRSILQLVRLADNLEDLALNERLLNSLSRELRENLTKNTELATNIVQIFFFFSTFSNFHDIIATHKIGFSCLSIVEHEIKQYAALKDAYDRKRRHYKAKKITKEEMIAVKKKFEEDEFAQDTLLYVALHLLMNVAEDTRVELKIRNKQIVGRLAECLKRQNVELLLLVVTFLKKLSVFLENKNEMVEGDVVQLLVPSLQSPCEPLQAVALRLLLNLSFDPRARARIVELGLLPTLFSLLAKPTMPPGVAGCVLYHISMDAALRTAFEAGDFIATLMRMVLQSRDGRPPTELIALGINLALNEKIAVSICGSGGLKMIVKVSLKTGDTLLFKMLRNLARNPPVQPMFLEVIDELAGLLMRTQDDDLLVEVVGILANLLIPDFNYEKLMEEYGLLDFIVQRLLPGAALDDLVLEIVVLVRTLLADDGCAQMMAKSGVIESMIELLRAKQEDDEFVLQIVCVFYRLVLLPSTRTILLGQTEAVSYLLDLLYDKQPTIREVCSRALDVIAEYDNEWAAKIRMRRFQAHNAEWLRAVLNEGPPEGDGYDQGPADDAYAQDMYVEDHADGGGAHYYSEYESGRYADEHRGQGRHPDDRYGQGHYDEAYGQAQYDEGAYGQARYGDDAHGQGRYGARGGYEHGYAGGDYGGVSDEDDDE
eukprot:m.116739 g.116739  ORF g.116739 m.116739 type:complete len:798 (-) comp9189_c0_seq1:179-2572(-)